MKDDIATQKKRAKAILRRLQQTYPDAGCELIYETPLQLAIAAILSAQCTDRRVNMVTPPLFQKYRTAKDWAAADRRTLEKELHSTGFYRNKTKNIQALCRTLCASHGGALPQHLDQLVALPGIGRKTANLIMSEAFREPAIIVDTHFMRLSRRLDFSRSTCADKVERELQSLIPRNHWSAWSDVMVFHGRRCCHARKPQCGSCSIKKYCPSHDQFAGG